MKYPSIPFFLLLSALCASCASGPQTSIGKAEVEDVSLALVRAQGDVYVGTLVRWGGIITEVENKIDETWVFVVSRALSNNEKPVSDGHSEGRFIASFSGFIDPLVYEPGRPLTVIGTIEGSTVRAIGEYDYSFPLVKVRDSHLWPKPDDSRVYYAPPPYWYYDPYFRHPYRHRHW